MTGSDEAAPPVVQTAPLGRDAAGSRGRLIRGALAVLAAVAALFGSWALLRNGVQVDTWPSFLADTGATSITRYSGPWITAAAFAALVAGLLLMMGAVDLVRYRRSARTSG